MTDRQGALVALLVAGSELRRRRRSSASTRCSRTTRSVVDKWFSLQATAPEHGGRVFERVKAAAAPSATSRIANPNRARSLIGAFCLGNPAASTAPTAAGYAFWADRVLELDAVNPQLASRLARALDRWTQLAEPYRAAARAAIARVAAPAEALDATRSEIVSRALAAG